MITGGLGNILAAPEDILLLKAIHKSTAISTKELADMLGEPYTQEDLEAYLPTLERRNLIKRVGDNPPRYKLTGLGFISIGVLQPQARIVFENVPHGKSFFFFLGVGPNKNTGLSASNLVELKNCVGIVDARSLEFHMSRGDLERWCKDVLGDEWLAKEMMQIRLLGLRGAQLRSKLLWAIDARIKKLIEPFESVEEL
jgi:hypothetical protein